MATYMSVHPVSVHRRQVEYGGHPHRPVVAVVVAVVVVVVVVALRSAPGPAE